MPFSRSASLPAVLASALLLAGCVTTESNQRAFAQLRDTLPCCQTMQEFPIETVTAKDTRFEIDATSPVFVFGQQKSYFRAFELPPEGTAYKLEVKSFPAYAPYASRTPIFMPGLLFLNAKKEAAAYWGPDKFRYSPEGWFEGRGIATVITVAETGDRPHYLVIFTPANSPEDGGGTMHTPATMTPVMIGGTMVPIMSGGGTSTTEPMPTGSLRLSIETLPPKPAAPATSQ
ncbi:MAG: hypothetical protein KG075_19570 [Alphaproteobacteria bacterium]|nr:hypothetical protein [Alphaproteobacteria bacterium]